MTRPLPKDKLDDAIRRYQVGESPSQIRSATGVSQTALYREIRRRGVPGQKRLATPAGLVGAYSSGASVNALAARFGMSRPAVRRMLTEAGLPLRDRSDAMVQRWSGADEGERSAMLEPAHLASRGRPQTEEHRISVAKGRAGIPLGPNETFLGGLLVARGLDVAYSEPCGRYNLDLLVDHAVAVEIFGGGWHASGRHQTRFPKRCRYVFDAGYHLAIIWVDERRYPLSVDCAQHVHALMKIARSDPTTRRQQWVIRGDGQLLATREDDGSEAPFIDATGHSSYLGT